MTAPLIAAFRRVVRTPTVLQMEAVECGAASLAMILASHGRWVPLEELRQQCGVSRDGSKASSVLLAAERHGLEANGMMCGVEAVFELPMPVVVFWEFRHFLVLEGRRGNHVFVNDPALGRRTISMAEFREGFTGVTLTFSPGPNFERTPPPPGVVTAMTKRLKGSGAAVALIVGVSLLLTVPTLALTGAIKAFIDQVLIRTAGDWLLPLVLALVAVGMVSHALTAMQQRLLMRLQAKLAVTTAAAMFWHVLRLPVVYFTQRSSGGVAFRLQACERIAAALTGPLSTNVTNLVVVFVYGAVLLAYSPWLAAITFALAGLNAAVLRMVANRRRQLSDLQLVASSKAMGTAVVGLQAIETLKASGSEADFFARWSGNHAEEVNIRQRLDAISACLTEAPRLIEMLTGAAVLGVGAFLVIRGRLTLGDLVAFQFLLQRFLQPVNGLVDFSGQLQALAADFVMVDDALRHPADPLLVRPAAAAPMARLSGAVEMRGVSFGYSPLDPPLIEDFSLNLAPGAHVALVGGSGSGKSTIAKLLLGLYRPTAGSILFDGVPVEEVPAEVLRVGVAHVDQDVFMFEGTILDNITMWDDTIPFATARQAAVDACIHEVCAARPGGYFSQVAEAGGNFSGGQRQRIEIARALARDPAVLVLDEATSALDPVTEVEINDNLRRRGCTRIVIAHRLSTVRDCDEIIVLDGGKVVERGRHEELLAAGNHYARLVRNQ